VSRFFAIGLLLAGQLHAQIIREAEDATLVSVTTATNIADYSGSGYVYMAGDGSLTFNVTAPSAGLYHVTLRVNTSQGAKAQKLFVNDVFFSTVLFPANNTWFDHAAGAATLNAGTNTIQIKKDWGYMYVDRITLTPATRHDYSLVDDAPIDPKADAKTRQLYANLRSRYGQKIIAGQTDYWTELTNMAERSPALRAFDMQNYSMHNPWHTDWSSWDDGTVQQAIDWYNSTGGDGIVSFQWHWFSPTEGSLSTSTFNTTSTAFDISKAVQAGTPENAATLRDIDAIAVQLKRLQAAGIPVLWRPLHEAGGGWFWWGAKGPAPAKALWNIMIDRLTNVHGLHNLIWVWSSPERDWYPGNDVVDIIGYDSYPGDHVYGTQKGVFDQLVDIVQGQKMVTMSENGPIPDIDACVAGDAMWLYFSSWGDLVVKQNSRTHIKQTYANPHVITLDHVGMPPTP